jgi:hypothetical protein
VVAGFRTPRGPWGWFNHLFSHPKPAKGVAGSATTLPLFFLFFIFFILNFIIFN